MELLLRARQTCVLAGIAPEHEGMRGMARRKAQTYGSAILAGPRQAPFGAPHALCLCALPRFALN